ncbi:hypothetical protein RJ639_028904 [Escallonia herrerae]|uniref:Histone-lysine N-methyltransferase, H3 lysine-9 specific SUVH4 n=1 Tax=Escallonia herrerae TaxID=1293975 RepID=A0AA88X975_9ASTE|nr:hypothetical protein RJ639_028904 [Escallonia herrerae]
MVAVVTDIEGMEGNGVNGDCVVIQRRSSARIQKLKTEMALRVRCRKDPPAAHAEEMGARKKTRVYQRRKVEVPDVKLGVVENGGSEFKADGFLGPLESNGRAVVVDGGEKKDLSLVEGIDNGVVAEKSVYARVTETLRSFNKHYLHFVQEEEKRCARVEADGKKAKRPKSKVSFVLVHVRMLSQSIKDAPEDDAKRGSKRPDLKAITKASILFNMLNALFTAHFFELMVLCDLPLIFICVARMLARVHSPLGCRGGIDVGHQFFSRCEMVAVGFHGHWLNGIDYIGQSGSKNLVFSLSFFFFKLSQEFNGYKLPLTVAIVLSGQYEDDLDNCEDIVYTGQGGNNLLGNKRQIRDQEMLRGNLGLKNAMEQGVPVRVVRGHKSSSSYVGKVYTYDGLYKVVHYWAEKGVSGFTVYKFRLKRLEGQPSLTTDQSCYDLGIMVMKCGQTFHREVSLLKLAVYPPLEVRLRTSIDRAMLGSLCTGSKPVHFERGRVPNSVSEIRGLVCEDIAGQLENIPVPATNLVDDPPVAPTGKFFFLNLKLPGFTYRSRIEVSKSVKLPMNAPGCNCKGKCTDPRSCACARLNGSDFPYVHRDGGRLIEPKAVVFECGQNCGCGPGCVNRTSQRGLKYRLEVFRTPKKGWAVRSWDYIPSGAPVCEYIGVLKKTDDVDSVPENNFIFDIDCLQTMKGLDGRERRLGDVSIPSHLEKDDDKKDSVPEFCIDAGSAGSVARFINHSCQPNLFVQCVLSDHHDLKLARVVLFAADNIPPLKELTYDYGYALDSVLGPDGKVRQMACYCGAADCRKRLF